MFYKIEIELNFLYCIVLYFFFLNQIFCVVFVTYDSKFQIPNSSLSRVLDNNILYFSVGLYFIESQSMGVMRNRWYYNNFIIKGYFTNILCVKSRRIDRLFWSFKHFGNEKCK